MASILWSEQQVVLARGIQIHSSQIRIIVARRPKPFPRSANHFQPQSSNKWASLSPNPSPSPSPSPNLNPNQQQQCPIGAIIMPRSGPI